MTECEKEAYQILRNVLWLNEENHEELYEEFILAVSQALQKKQDEIEKLKNLTHFGYSEVPELKNEIERLKVELNQYQTQTVNVVAFHKLEDEVQRLTARNKELEQENQHLANVSVSLNSKIEDFKKSEKALQGRTVSCEACNGMAEKVKELELILYNHSDDVIRNCYHMIKGLESKLVGLIDQNGKVMIENHDLKSKLAAAREVLEIAIRVEKDEYVFTYYRKKLEKALAELGEKKGE